MGVVDCSEFDVENLESGARCETAGKATFEIDSCIEKDGDKGPYYSCKFIVRAHDVKSEVGKEYYQTLPLSGKMAKAVVQLGRACGLITDADIAESKLQGTKSLEVNLEAAAGMYVCGEITAPKDPQYRPKVWDWLNPTSPAASKFPKPAGTGSTETEPAAKKTTKPKVEPVDVSDDEDPDDLPF